VVSVVHITKGIVRSPVLDGCPSRRISAYLVDGELDTSPAALGRNSGKAFNGTKIYGQGFTFDDTAAKKGEAEPLEVMRRLIDVNARNAERIFPYIGGDEVNTDPEHRHHRYVIDFADFPLKREGMPTSWRMMAAHEREDSLRVGVVPTDYTWPASAMTARTGTPRSSVFRAGGPSRSLSFC
jgi:hypothetical protein